MNTAIRGNPVPAHQNWIHAFSITKSWPRSSFFFLFPSILGAQTLLRAAPTEAGIPVADPVVIAKCSPCHRRDESGNMARISWERTTPEGWQEAVKKMLVEKRVSLTPDEARAIVKYLSSTHGLAPEEAKPVMYYPERRIHDETALIALEECGRCHPAGRVLSWRRSPEDWQELAETHLAQYKVQKNSAVMRYLTAAVPLHSPEWERWTAQAAPRSVEGAWLVTARLAGRGTYVGEMRVTPGAASGDFTTRVTLESIKDGSTLIRTGQAALFGGYGWRGRSRGGGAPGSPEDPSNEAREAVWFSPDGLTAEGRWFWGQYQEFGFDVKLQRAAAGPALLALDRRSLKAGSRSAVIQLFGSGFPALIGSRDLSLGRGITVRSIVSHDARKITAELEVAADADLGLRDVSVQSSTLPGALAIYDRIDYIKVAPESAMAGFGSGAFNRGYQQFEAIGYQRGPDGKLHTADDLELGPVDATWSIQVFYAVDDSGNDKVGKMSPAGLFTPAAQNPGVNSDIWVVATALHEVNPRGRPLVAKAYVVVTIPEYTFNGRHYVRDLDRWIEEGTW